MPSPQTSPDIPFWEQEILSMFVGVFETFGLPKSTALIFGTLYCALEPMTQDEIVARLGISTGSASQGLRLLQSIGAVHRHFPIGQRQSLYSPELSMRRLVGHILTSHLRPKLLHSRQRLQSLAQDLDPADPHPHQRIQTLLGWQKKIDAGLPVLAGLFGQPPLGK